MVTGNEESKMLTVEVTKQAWVDEYASRILQVWYKWPSPFGLDKQYSKEVKSQLSEYFDDPLKRDLIETTY